MRYHVCRDPDATDPARRWIVIDDEYGLVVAYRATKGEAAEIADQNTPRTSSPTFPPTFAHRSA